MNKLFGAAAVVAALVAPTGARADDAKDAAAVIDKAVQALGGEAKLARAAGFSTKAKATIAVMGMEFEIDLASTTKGTDHLRSQFAGDFGGTRVEGVTVIVGDKGWRKMGDETTDLDADAVANEKRNAYLAAAPVNPLTLKGKGFKLAPAADEKVGDKPAAVLTATGPDGKDFKLYFDKQTGLPVKQAAAKMAGFMGDEADQEWLFADYKDMGGVKRATKVTVTRGGEKFITQEITEFKVLDTVDPKAFEKP